jgi:hypothetical protein
VLNLPQSDSWPGKPDYYLGQLKAYARFVRNYDPAQQQDPNRMLKISVERCRTGRLASILDGALGRAEPTQEVPR